MSIPKLYTILPKKEDGNLDVDVLTDHSSEITTGSDGETFVVLSYFPGTQKFSELSNFVLNKYVLFVLDEDEAKSYDIQWQYDVFDEDGTSVLDDFVQDEIAMPNNFEFSLGLKHVGTRTAQYWEFTLKINCHISKNGVFDKTLELESLLIPIEQDLLSENGASFEDESGSSSAVSLGNEGTTHFMRGHLSEYLVSKMKSLNPDSSEPANNASVFVKQTASIAYNNVLGTYDALKPIEPLAGVSENYTTPFHSLFVNQEIEIAIINETGIETSPFRDIGICSLNLHHVLPIIQESQASRIESEEELRSVLESTHLLEYDTYIIAYLRSVFPKSAIGLSVDILDKLFTAFKAEAHDSFQIYETFETSRVDQNAKIEAWTQLNYSELGESGNDDFMKNLIGEYSLGYYVTVTSYARSISQPERVLRIDGSQFIQKILNPSLSLFSLGDFLTTNESLNQKVDSIFNTLSAHDRVAQMLMPAAGSLGQSERKIRTLLEERKIGGILMLKGSKDEFTGWTQEYSEMSAEIGTLPLFFSADAEPSLINDKISEIDTVLKAKQITNLTQVEETAAKISEIITEIGINYNFAPVVDVGKNKTAGFRSFAVLNEANNIPFAKKFIQTMQDNNIIATAKHFPGHGQVSGDTHEGLQVIDGDLTELKYYPPLIEDGLLSIMIAHIAVKNNSQYNTGGLPSTLSKTIVTDLLRDELGFKGLIVTDAMNMGGVTHVADGYVKAVEAGIDILEMPVDASQAHADILEKYNDDAEFKEKVHKACKRIIRMKVCLGLI